MYPALSALSSSSPIVPYCPSFQLGAGLIVFVAGGLCSHHLIPDAVRVQRVWEKLLNGSVVESSSKDV